MRYDRAHTHGKGALETHCFMYDTICGSTIRMKIDDVAGLIVIAPGLI